MLLFFIFGQLLEFPDWKAPTSALPTSAPVGGSSVTAFVTSLQLQRLEFALIRSVGTA